jgi:4-amino-4-deoxy-L-arabinose transferase-like glycosyltransferase
MESRLNVINPYLTACIAACLIVCFSGIAGHDLWTPDEPRVAAISLEMANTGEIIIPHLGGEPFIEKPPLHFAISALMIRLFGPITGNTTALRLTSALFGIGVLIFTFLIARRIGDSKTGIESVLILGTMIGFIQNYHWIRVDTSLAFFIIVSLWCFIEAYYRNSPGMLIFAGIFAGCAFLSKGLIGPVLIFVPWTGLVIFWVSQFNKNRLNARPWILFHFLSLLAFLVISSLWVVQLYFKGGEQLWHEWFYVNHLGRFTGTAVAKGHLKEGQPFYYIVQLCIYGMPWTPLILFWFIQNSVKTVKNRIINKETFFLLIWGAGSLLLLSIPTTKRGIYLTPVLPAFAIMASLSFQALELKQFHFKWFKKYAAIWVSLCVVTLFCIAVLPLTISFLPGQIPEEIVRAIMQTDYLNRIIAPGSLFVLITILYGYKNRFSARYKIVFATAMLFIAVFGLPFKVVDTVKSMQLDIRHFVSSIPPAKRDKIAGTGFSETMLGSIYYYTEWKVPQITDQNRIQSILQGKDKEYTTLLINRKKVKNRKTELTDSKYNIVKYIVTGRNRGLFLIKGGK